MTTILTQKKKQEPQSSEVCSPSLFGIFPTQHSIDPGRSDRYLSRRRNELGNGTICSSVRQQPLVKLADGTAEESTSGAMNQTGGHVHLSGNV